MFTGRFDEKMGKDERKEVLRKLRSALEAKQEYSTRKTHILKLVLDYADECLTGFFTKQLDPYRFSDVSSIFANANLDDILFMQHVVNRLSPILDDNSRLKSRVLPSTLIYRDALLAPSTANIRNILLAGALLALCSREGLICLIAVIGALSAHHIALSRLEQALKNKQTEKLLQGDVPKIGDGLDEHLLEGSEAAGKLLKAAATSTISMANQTARLFAATDRNQQHPTALTSVVRGTLMAPTKR